MNTKPASEVQKGDHVIIPQPYTTFLAPGSQAPVEVTAVHHDPGWGTTEDDLCPPFCSYLYQGTPERCRKWIQPGLVFTG